MSDRGDKHEQMLASILAGEIDPASEQARSCLDEAGLDPAALDELLLVGRQLDATARFEREILAAVRDGGGEEGARERVAAVLHRLRREAGAAGATAGGPRRIVWIGLAAAAVLLLAVPFLFQNGDHLPAVDRPPTVLGNGVEDLEPVGTVDSLTAFRWKRELPAGGWYEVNVYTRGGLGSGEPLLSSGELFTPEWKPGDTLLAELPDSIDWEVLVYDAGRMPVARAVASTSVTGDRD